MSVSVEAQHRRLRGEFGAEVAQALVREQERGTRVGDGEAETSVRVERVERDVSGPGLEDAEQ